jgi:predicted RNA methylase
MIRDKVRTEAYREAIEKLVKDQVVVDVGAGTGILSIFAAVAGARKVYAIENAGIVSICRQNVKERELSEKIEVIQSLAEEAALPVEKVDLIVSEWIGYFLLFERMLPSVL